jgi:hypothetical protein
MTDILIIPSHIGDIRIESLEPDNPYCVKCYGLPEFRRHVTLNLTVMGSLRFCVTEEITGEMASNDTFDRLSWCFGTTDTLVKTLQSFMAIIIALRRGNFNRLPRYSRIKPIEHDEVFLTEIKMLTGVQIVEYVPLPDCV